MKTQTVNAPPVIQFRNVTLAYGSTEVLKDISFPIYPGDFFGIVGPNGSGKTTLLRAIIGTLRPRRGEVLIAASGGGPLRIGYVPQVDVIDPIMPFTVEDVVMMGRYSSLGLLRRPDATDRVKVHAALTSAGISHLANESYRDLSGGQKQRALIARALTTEPSVLVLDEPTNGMDLTSRTSILELIRTLHGERRLTVIMVSHLLSDVAAYARRIIIVEQGLFQVGPVEEILTAKNLSQVYKMPVHVGRVQDAPVIVPGKPHD